MVFDFVSNKEVYVYVYKICNFIFNFGVFVYKNDFFWKVCVICDDKMLNVFCMLGGYIYVYIGIMKYMDNEV